MRLSENFGIVPVLKPGDHTAGLSGTSIDMSGWSHCTFLINAATITGNPVITVFSGANTGTKTTRIVGKYRMATTAQGAVNADVYGAETALGSEATGLSFVGTTFFNKMTVIEVDATQMAAGEKWLTFAIEKGSSSAANMSVEAILSGGRYKDKTMPSAIGTAL